MLFQSPFWLNEVDKKLEQLIKSLHLDEVEMPPPPVIIPFGPVSGTMTSDSNSAFLRKPLPGSFPVDDPLEPPPEEEFTENYDAAESVSDDRSFNSTEVQRGTNTPVPELQPLDDSEATLVNTHPGSSNETTSSDRATFPAHPVEPYVFTDPTPRRSKYPNFNAFRSRTAPSPATTNEPSDYAEFLKQAEDAKSVGGETTWSVQTVYTDVSDDPADAENWTFHMDRPESLADREQDIENWGTYSKPSYPSARIRQPLRDNTAHFDIENQEVYSNPSYPSATTVRRPLQDITAHFDIENQEVYSKLSYPSTRLRQPLRDITAHFGTPFDDQERPLGRDYNYNYNTTVPCYSDPAAVQKSQQQSQPRQEKVAREIDMSPFGDDTRSKGDILKRGVPWGFHGRDYCPPVVKEHFLKETLRGMKVRRRGLMERGGILERVKFWGRRLMVKVRQIV